MSVCVCVWRRWCTTTRNECCKNIITFAACFFLFLFLLQIMFGLAAHRKKFAEKCCCFYFVHLILIDALNNYNFQRFRWWCCCCCWRCCSGYNNSQHRELSFSKFFIFFNFFKHLNFAAFIHKITKWVYRKRRFIEMQIVLKSFTR